MHLPKLVRGNDYPQAKGFSLIEVLLFLLVVFGLVTVLFSSAGVLSKTRGTNLESIASGIARCEIEQLRNTSFGSITNGTGVEIQAPCNQDVSKLPACSSPPCATRTIADYQSDPDIKSVTITINWIENTVNKDIKMSTLISRYGL